MPPSRHARRSRRVRLTLRQSPCGNLRRGEFSSIPRPRARRGAPRQRLRGRRSIATRRAGRAGQRFSFVICRTATPSHGLLCRDHAAWLCRSPFAASVSPPGSPRNAGAWDRGILARAPRPCTRHEGHCAAEILPTWRSAAPDHCGRNAAFVCRKAALLSERSDLVRRESRRDDHDDPCFFGLRRSAPSPRKVIRTRSRQSPGY